MKKNEYKEHSIENEVFNNTANRKTNINFKEISK